MQKFRLIKLALLSVVLWIGMAAGARSAGAWFTQAPDRVISGIPRGVRLDAIDYFRSGISRDVKTEGGMAVRITELTDNTITIRRGEYNTLQLAVLPAGLDTILAVISTVDSPTGVSGIEFYDKEWHRTARRPFRMPKFTEWLMPGRQAEAEILQATLGFIPATARFSNTADTLFLTNTAIENAALNGVADALVTERVYKVKNAKFSPVK